MDTKILIIGACGQIGTELTAKLRATYGVNNVIASDIRKLENDVVNNGIFEVVNALDYNQIEHLLEKYQITDVYLMAALLSATAEKNTEADEASSPPRNTCLTDSSLIAFKKAPHCGRAV